GDSSHDISMVKGLVYGETLRAATHCKKIQDFSRAKKALFSRLAKRNYNPEFLATCKVATHFERANYLANILRSERTQPPPPPYFRAPADNRIDLKSVVGPPIHRTWEAYDMESLFDQPPYICMTSHPSIGKTLIRADIFAREPSPLD